MRKHNSLFPVAVLFMLILVACEGQPTQVPTLAAREPPTVVPPTLPPTPVPPTATRVQPTAMPTAQPRTATIKEIVNKVDARTSAALTFLEARLGLGLNVGGQVRTGDSSKTRLDFSEGTIVRLGQDTILTVEELTTASGNPLTRFQLELGKLWISLFGGTMEIKTPVGVATVRGSYAVIECKAQPVECTFDLIEGSGHFGGQPQTNMQRVVLGLDGSSTHSWLGPSAVFDFCENNPEGCGDVTQKLDAWWPQWRGLLHAQYKPAGPPDQGPPPPPVFFFILPCISRVC